MPDNYIHLGLLATLFPNAVFIHCRRDLRDVAVSCWMTGFRSVRWTNDTQHIATRFQQYDRLMNHWQAVLPAPIHEVDYEETVDDLEGVARRLSRPADWTGSRPASTSTAPAGRSAQPASVRCASRSTVAPSAAGRTTRPSWPTSSRHCRRRAPSDSS